MRPLATVALLVLVGCGGIVQFSEEGSGDGAAEASASGAGGGPGPSTSSTSGGSQVASSSAGAGGSGASDTTASAVGAGGGGGEGTADPGCGPIVAGDPSPCLTGGSVVCFDGDAEEWIHPGRQRITGDGSAWNVPPTFGGTRLDTLELKIDADNSDQDTWWLLVFSSRQMGQDLAVGEYVNAERYPFEAPGAPGLDVTGDGRGCNIVRGDFQITSVEVTGDEITSLTATFEQHCDYIPAVLRGCVHLER